MNPQFDIHEPDMDEIRKKHRPKHKTWYPDDHMDPVEPEPVILGLDDKYAILALIAPTAISFHSRTYENADQAFRKEWSRIPLWTRIRKSTACPAKIRLMEQILNAKFRQDEMACAVLLATDDDLLLDTSDPFWGVASGGENHLGKLLMKLRDTLRTEKENDMPYIHNTPDYAYNPENPYLVARIVDGERWFYGAYETYERAESVAFELGNAIVIQNTEAG